MEKICLYCGKLFKAQTDRARYCCGACKQAAYRRRNAKKQELKGEQQK